MSSYWNLTSMTYELNVMELILSTDRIAMSGDAFFWEGQRFTLLSLDEAVQHAGYGSSYISYSSNLYCQYRDLAGFNSHVR